MHIEELKDEREVVGFVVGVQQEEIVVKDLNREEIVVSHAKRALVGAGARVLFYPTLLYNLVRNKIQAEFRWWDQVDEFLLLGAVPFPTDVLRLKELGVCGVVTLNEPYETLVPTSLYHAHNIDHLVIPTRDYLFAPSYADICQAVDFINKNASCGKTTYVHCKAGRGRSTTIVLCYLVQHRQMTPDAAYAYVKSIRSRVLLAPAQRQAVQEFYRLSMKSTTILSQLTMRRPYISHHLVVRTPMFHTPKSIETSDSTEFMDGLDSSHFVVKNSDSPTSQGTTAFDDSSVVVVTESDLDGYDGSYDSGIVGNEICAAELSIVYRVQFASQAALARLSGLRLSCIYARQKMSGERLRRENSCSVGADKLGGVGVDIHVY